MRSKLLILGLLFLSGLMLIAQENPAPTTEEPVAIEDDEAAFIKKIDPAVVVIQHERGLGSGFIVSPDGYILTNGHVVSAAISDRSEEDPKEIAKKITVTLYDETKHQAKVIGLCLDPDVALIKIETKKELTPLKIGNSDNVKSRQKVYAYGAPGGMKRTLTAGIVSNTERTDLPTFTKVIQTDAAINPGNSGGPLLTEEAEVIGVNTYGGRGSGIGFTIPINVVSVLKDHFMKYSYFKRADFPYFITSEIYEELGQTLGLEEGILVDYVVPDSPADKAGLKSGDIIIKVNGEKVSAKNKAQIRDFSWKMSIREVGSPVKFTVKRGTKGNFTEETVSGTLVEDEPAVEYAYQLGEIKEIRYDDLGLGVKRMTTATSLIYRMPLVPGVRVVRAEGAISKAGIGRGDIITQIDNQPVKDEDDFQEKLENCLAKNQKYILVTLRRGNETVKTAVKPNYELAGKKLVVIRPEGQVEYFDIVKRFLLVNGIQFEFVLNTVNLPTTDANGLLLLSGERNYWDNKGVHQLIQQAVKGQKVIGALGAASVTLVKADKSLLTKKITTDEDYANMLINYKANYTGKDVEIDENVVTTTGFDNKVVKSFLRELRNALLRQE